MVGPNCKFSTHPFKRTGFSLVELLISAFVLSVGIAGTLMFFTSALISADFALETTLATSHAELIFEEMRSKEAIQEITFVDWNEWLKKQDVSLLPEEAVEISYLDPAKSPFPVSMKVSWRGRARIQTQEFYTTFIK